MERIEGFFLEAGYRKLPEMYVDSLGGMVSFTDKYGYPVIIESGKVRIMVREKKELEVFNKISLDKVTVKKYLEKSLSVYVGYHSEYDIVSIEMEKGNKKYDIRVNPMVILTGYRIKRDFPELADFAGEICNFYNIFLNNNYKKMSVAFYKDKEEVYFSMIRKSVVQKEKYDSVLITCNDGVIGEYVEDLFRRYGKRAYVVPIESMKKFLGEYTYILAIIVNDDVSRIEAYKNILSDSGAEKNVYCIYQGVGDREIKKDLINSRNIVFINEPSDFVKRVVNGDR